VWGPRRFAPPRLPDVAGLANPSVADPAKARRVMCQFMALVPQPCKADGCLSATPLPHAGKTAGQAFKRSQNDALKQRRAGRASCIARFCHRDMETVVRGCGGVVAITSDRRPAHCLAQAQR
jgi:hypothetical protein